MAWDRGCGWDLVCSERKPKKRGNDRTCFVVWHSNRRFHFLFSLRALLALRSPIFSMYCYRHGRAGTRRSSLTGIVAACDARAAHAPDHVKSVIIFTGVVAPLNIVSMFIQFSNILTNPRPLQVGAVARYKLASASH